MTEERTERSMSPEDVARLASALLQAIDRGDVEATPADVAFLRSLADTTATRS